MHGDPDGLIIRHLEPVITERLAEEPVVVVTGARTVGKSTLLRSCARAHGVSVTDLDEPEVRRSVEEDPALFVSGAAAPVCIDEFQHVPALLDTIKAQLNRDLRPGRFLITGSTRYSMLPRTSQSLTGRADVTVMWPFSQGELNGHRETFLDRLINDPEQLLTAAPASTSRSEYERLILAGGFPIAVSRASRAARARWFSNFVTMVIERDVLELRRVRQRELLPRVLGQLAAQTGGVLRISDVASTVGLDKGLAGDFVTLLESVFLIHRLQPFGRTLSSRVSRTPKVHVVDSGLAAHLLGVTERRLSVRNPATLTEFGHVVETFAVNELIKQAGWTDALLEFFHFRTRDQTEVDLVVQTHEGLVAAVEIKAKGTATDNDVRGLRLLRDRLGPDFVGGVLLNLGTRSYSYEDRIYVMPLDRLWTDPGSLARQE